MPHFLLECSDNIVETIDPKDFFPALHELLIGSGPFNLQEIKSRVIRHQEYFIADGAPDKAFVHLTLSILEGREIGLQKTVGKKVLEFLKERFQASAQKRELALSLEIREMSRETYFKETIRGTK